MVIIMKPGTSQNEIRKLAAQFEADNLKSALLPVWIVRSWDWLATPVIWIWIK